MKKLLILLFLGLAFLLVSCGSVNVAYTDPETGENKILEVKETDNPTEVIESIKAILMSDVRIASHLEESESLSMNVIYNYSDGTTTRKINLKISGSYDIKFNTKDVVFNSTNEILNAISMSGELTISNIPYLENSSKTTIKESKISMYIEDGIFYGKMNLDPSLISAFDDTETIEDMDLTNYNIIKFKIYSLPSRVFWSYQTRFITDTIIGGKSVRSALINALPLESLARDLSNTVNQYGITITNVSGSKVTFGIDTQKITNMPGTLEVTLDVSDFSICDTKMNCYQILQQNDVKSELKILLKSDIKYSSNVKTLSEEDKKDAFDLSPYIIEMVRKYYY